MKNLLFLLLLVPFAMNGQDQTTIRPNYNAAEIRNRDYTEVDAFAVNFKQNYTGAGVKYLSKLLTENFKTDAEKVRSIYMWITNTISYDFKEFRTGKIAGTLSNYDFDTYEQYSECFANIVLYSKKGICGGYSQLFYELCNESKIKCEIVYGFADTNTKLVQRFKKTNFFEDNHAWNKVLVDGTWYYVDLTWSSGYGIGRPRKFRKRLDPEYYLTPMDQLYPTHVIQRGFFAHSCS